MAKSKTIIEGPEIKIVGTEDRFQIVKEVVNMFIDFEKDKKGKDIMFKYSVEKLSTGQKLYIQRPGVKKNFDFKVEIPKNAGLEEGRHDQIALVLRYLRQKEEPLFKSIWDILTYLYCCKNNNVDEMLKRTRLPNSVSVNLECLSKVVNVNLECLLKVVKWLFIMEDIFYWDYEGRATLYNYFKYVIYENDQKRLCNKLYKHTKGGIKRINLSPDDLKKLLGEISQEWEAP